MVFDFFCQKVNGIFLFVTDTSSKNINHFPNFHKSKSILVLFHQISFKNNGMTICKDNEYFQNFHPK